MIHELHDMCTRCNKEIIAHDPHGNHGFWEPLSFRDNCVPKKGGITVVPNDKNELIPQRIVTGYRMVINFRKFNKATRKDQYPLPFIDQMLEILSKHTHFCFLDGYSGFSQIPISHEDQEKTTFTCPFGTYAYGRMPLVYAMHLLPFKDVWLHILWFLWKDCWGFHG